MKGLLRSVRRLRMSPLERVVDNLRNKEFKEAGNLAKKELSKFDGKELAESVSDKLSQLDHFQRREFFEELAKSPEKLKHMISESDEFNKAVDYIEERDLKRDLLTALGTIFLVCAFIRMLRRK